MFDEIKEKLKEAKIITSKDNINTNLKKLLPKYPELEKEILDITSYLRYEGSIKDRLLYILYDIDYQPLCKECDAPIKFLKRAKDIDKVPEFCSNECVNKSKVVRERTINTNMERYGVKTSSQCKKVKEKAEQTNLKRYGVKFVSQSVEVKERIKKRNIERFGVDNPWKSKEIRDKIKKTNVERYSVKNPMQSKEVQEKAIDTRVKRYGVEYGAQCKEIQERCKQTCVERYGFQNPIQSKEVQEKAKRTNLKNLGVKYLFQDKDFRVNSKQALKERYGVDHPMRSDLIKQRLKETNLERYGVESPAQKHISKETFERLNDAQWLEYQHHNLKKCAREIARDLTDVSYSIVIKHINKHNIRFIKRYNTSMAENSVADFITKELGVNIVRNSRDVISPKEVDIWVPEFNLAIEFDGIYWHSELAGKPKNYHLDKTLEAQKNGVQLIHIFENDWVNKEEIVKSRIKSKLNRGTKIWARKCQVVSLSNTSRRIFFNQTHIQGDTPSAKDSYALLYDNEIVAAMSFGVPRYNKKIEWELLRYSSKLGTNVVGGAGKLFSHFINSYEPTNVISYSDKRWGSGSLYSKLGFKELKDSGPNYWYFHFDNPFELYHRSTFQKHKLCKLLEDFNPEMTEWQNMVNNGWNRIFDCGNSVFIYTSEC
jgi:hypothetical protein